MIKQMLYNRWYKKLTETGVRSAAVSLYGLIFLAAMISVPGSVMFVPPETYAGTPFWDSRTFEERAAILEKYNQTAWQLLERGFNSLAIEYARCVIRKHSRGDSRIFLEDAFYIIGKAHLNRGRADRAIDFFTKVLELNPAHVNALLGRGEAWLKKGYLGLAIMDFRLAANLGHSEAIKRFEEVSGLEFLVRDPRWTLKPPPESSSEFAGKRRSSETEKGTFETELLEAVRKYSSENPEEIARKKAPELSGGLEKLRLSDGSIIIFSTRPEKGYVIGAEISSPPGSRTKRKVFFQDRKRAAIAVYETLRGRGEILPAFKPRIENTSRTEPPPLTIVPE